ncbi:MAG: DUF4365 domain-containing protein [Okeania sp. SIO2F4]|uniref:DUF4365 domain-containing protein n=1 Tax=Okeania sp. SIO2F4 TaxID=2607790 RepID=UPI00142A4D40|nr:DUF4365 domain-containing protein [Okeania sp. SIO2F4]NES02547.1 DUF4365 domain-containing protein [Okeania sp. SIO2F4]
MDTNSQKEYFSYAYVRAVAAVAGYSVEEKSRPMDNAGIDLTIEAPGDFLSKVDAQVKCTASTNIIKANTINFPLPRKNYDTLRRESLVPLILIVVLVPDKLTEWMTISKEECVMRKCGYWASLKGEPSTKNKETVTVKLSRKNLFTPDNLSKIMEKINNREEL